VILLDVNVLVAAHREDAPRHAEVHRWLADVVNGVEGFGVADLVLGGFVRVVTHPRVFSPPTPLARALEFVEALRSSPAAIVVGPAARHWELFLRACRDGRVQGNLVPDAWLAALAIESGCEWITFDADYARFPGLRWRRPVE
jgi:toxin-antitoxin system PIN domain toxin